MITLNHVKPIGRGSHREVYPHPENPDHCLKVMIEDWRQCDRRQRASWLSKTFRRKRHFHENLGELHFSKQIHKRVGDHASDYFAKSYGLVQTDKGEALEVQMIKDHDGQISLSLKAYLLKFGLTEEAKLAINEFWEGVMKYGIFVQGRPDNVSIRQLKDNRCQIIAIDGFGLPHLIPVANWLKSARLKYLRKWQKKQQRSINQLLEAKESGETISKKGIIQDPQPTQNT